MDLGGLTARERQVYDLMMSGIHQKQIGARLGISVAMVKSHMRHICAKLRIPCSRAILMSRRIADLESGIYGQVDLYPGAD